MVQWIGAGTALSEGPGLVPSIDFRNFTTPGNSIFGNPTLFSGLSCPNLYTNTHLK